MWLLQHKCLVTLKNLLKVATTFYEHPRPKPLFFVYVLPVAFSSLLVPQSILIHGISYRFIFRIQGIFKAFSHHIFQNPKALLYGEEHQIYLCNKSVFISREKKYRKNIIDIITGLHQERAYTYSGISCPECVNQFFCCLLMHNMHFYLNE